MHKINEGKYKMTNTTHSKNGKMVVCLNVKDLKASNEFYKKLGFAQIGGNIKKEWSIMNDGENELHLFQGHVSSNTLNFRGGDVFAIAASLKTQGLKMTSDAKKESDGSDGAWINDPDDNTIYFNTAPGERRFNT